MVLSIISCLFAFILLIFASIEFGLPVEEANKTVVGIQIFVCLLQGIAAIVASAFSCRVVCCGGKQHPDQVIFVQNQEGYNNADLLTVDVRNVQQAREDYGKFTLKIASKKSLYIFLLSQKSPRPDTRMSHKRISVRNI